ncbi:hypothetical protein HFN71_28875 [Rhizobium laguerreae]|uniref:hypothetical protein n=1 Tax=Rhizobium laguerreae TaxID=1076926 RepID=UPI001C90C3C1|nr:hypothetical protein [Rhizobium laguerreae]MBY3543699.1 hypothetical protein [Rhizobium laguerreae]
MQFEDEQRLSKKWRGRRLLACRAADTFDRIIDELGLDDGSDLPPDSGIPKITEGLRIELHNQVAVLLRMILTMNDNATSGSRLQRW